jgi:hypothetical protein
MSLYLWLPTSADHQGKIKFVGLGTEQSPPRGLQQPWSSSRIVFFGRSVGHHPFRRKTRVGDQPTLVRPLTPLYIPGIAANAMLGLLAEQGGLHP